MNLDELKSSWHQQCLSLADSQLRADACDIAERATRFEQAIVRRDYIEATAALFVFAGFAWGFTQVDLPPVAIAGVAIIMAGVVEIVVVLFWTRWRGGNTKSHLSVVAYSRRELERIQRQIVLLRNVSWWYSGPILVGCCVLLFGILHAIPELPATTTYGFLAAFYLCFLAAGFIGHKINQKAVNTELIPLRDQIVGFLAAILEHDESADEVWSPGPQAQIDIQHSAEDGSTTQPQ